MIVRRWAAAAEQIERDLDGCPDCRRLEAELEAAKAAMEEAAVALAQLRQVVRSISLGLQEGPAVRPRT